MAPRYRCPHGPEERTPSGSCRGCKRRRAERPCKCGSTDRTPAGTCRPCQKILNARPKGRAARSAHAKKDSVRARVKELRLMQLYGMTQAQLDALRDAQRGLCPVCHRQLPSGNQSHIDHDHVTGQVRGILCGDCNRAEGMLRGSPLRAERLAAYLRKHAPKLRIA